MALFNQKTAAVLTEQLGAVLRELNDTRAKRAGLMAVAEDDAAYAKLATMEGQIAALTAKEARLRDEITNAVEAERLAELDKRWDAYVEVAGRKHASADRIDAIVVTLCEAIEEHRADIVESERVLPVRGVDYRSELQGSAASYAFDALRGRLTRDGTIRSLGAMSREETGVALKARLPKQEQDVSTVVGPAPGESPRPGE